MKNIFTLIVRKDVKQKWRQLIYDEHAKTKLLQKGLYNFEGYISRLFFSFSCKLNIVESDEFRIGTDPEFRVPPPPDWRY
jgi:hypothetical protein